MDVYLLEAIYEDGTCFEEILLYVPIAEKWMGDVGKDEEKIEEIKFTSEFYKTIDIYHKLTKIGEF